MSQRKKLPVPFVLSCFFVFLIIAASSLIAYVSLQNEKHAVEDMARQVQTEIFAGIREKLGDYLAMPHRLNRLNGNILVQEPALMQNLEGLRPVFIRQIKAFESVSTVAAGIEEQGNYVGIARREPGFFSSGLMIREKDSTYRVSLLDDQGKVIKLLTESPDYDARNRDWYKTAAQAGKAAWSPVYIWVGGTDIGLTAVLPVYDHAGKLFAVQQSALTLDFISGFLKDLKKDRLAKSGQIFIAEPNGMLLASSGEEKAIRKKDKKFERMTAGESSEIFIRRAWEALGTQFADTNAIPDNWHSCMKMEGENFFLSAAKLTDPHGLNWIMITGQPEAGIMAKTEANTRISIVLCLVISFTAICFGILIGRRLMAVYGNLESEIERRTEAEQSLRESEILLNETGRIAKVGGWKFDPGTEKILWTEEMYSIYELQRDYKPSFQEALSFFHQESGEKLTAAIQRAFDLGESYDLELRFITAKGKQLWTRAICRPQVVNGVTVKLTGVFQDITQRKQAREIIKESEQQFRSMFENHAAVMLLVEPESGRIIRANHSAHKYYGYSAEAFESLTIFQINQLNREETASEMAKAKAENRNYFHFPHKLANSEIRDVEVHSSPIPFKGKNILFSIIHDITERRRAEEALRKSEERYRKSQALGCLGNWEYNIQTMLFWGSDEAKRIYGFDVNADSFTADEVENCIPERSKVHQALLDLIERDKEYNLEFDIITKDTQKRKTIISIAGLERDESGRPLKITGLIQDITQRKQMENSLRVSLEKYRILFESFPIGVSVTDANGNLIEVNQESERLLGVSVTEHTGRRIDSWKWKIIRPDGTPMPTEEYASVRALKAGHMIKNVEMGIVKENQEVTWLNVHAAPIPFEGYGVIITYHDITDRRHAEEALHRIEWLLSKSIVPSSMKEVPYQPPYSDVTELNTCRIIMDSVGKETLRRIAENTIDLLDTSVAVYEKNGDYAFGMFSSGWCRLMDSASRKLCGMEDDREALTCGRWLCHENCWNDSAKTAIQTGQVTDIECAGGIRLYAVPIFAGDEVIGVINIGYGDPPKDEAGLRELAEKFGISMEEIKQNAEIYESRPPYIVELAKKRLHTTAALIGEIAERRRTGKALEKSEALFKGLFDHMTSGSAIYEVINDGSKGADYIIRGFNKKSLEIEGKKLEQVLGKSLFDLRPAIDDYGLIPVMKKVWQTGKPGFLPVRIYQDDTFSNYYENHIFKIPSGEVVTVYNDVTHQKLQEIALKESEERFELAMKFSRDGIFDWNLRTNQCYYSPGWKKILGYEDHEIQNSFSEWERLTRPEDVQASWALMNELLAGKQNRFEKEFQMRHRDGHWVDIFARANVVFDEQGKGVRVVGTHVDITERKRAEAELRRAKEAAEAATRAKSEFLAGMSHEIRTPMNVIVNMAALLLETPLNSEQNHYCVMMKASSDILLSLINDILDFSKIEAGKMDLEKTAFNLADVAEEVVRILSLRADEKGLRLRHRIAEDVHLYLIGDPLRLRQILLNLTNNAIKFTEKGEVKISVTSKKQSQTHTLILFEISDTGIGIPKERMECLFKPFSQTDSSTTRRFGGTGLGLSISKNLAEMMGGRVGAESEYGIGSTFWFTAVFEKREKSIQDEKSRNFRKAVSENISLPPDLRILLVEDNLFNQQVALAVLRKFSLRADIANNGKPAVEMLEKKTYDLVLMDIEMPEMDGMEATKIIRNSSCPNRNVPIIAMTAHALTGSRERYMQAGMNDYIPKPLNPNEIFAAIVRNIVISSGPVTVSADPVQTKDSPSLSPVPNEIFSPVSAEIPQLKQENTCSVFDRQDLLRRMGGDENIVKIVLEDFDLHFSEELEKLKISVQENNAEKIRFQAHALKGMAANASASRLRDAACELETAAKQGNTDAAYSLLKKVEQEFDCLLGVLSLK